MELRTYVEILGRRSGIIVLTTVVSVIIVWLGIQRITPVYAATTTVRVLTNFEGNDDVFGKLQYVERLMNTYASIATSDPMLRQLQQQVAITGSPADLSKQIKIEFPANTELMQISIENKDPVLAAKAANALTELLIAESLKTRVGRTFAISLIEPATPPIRPTKPNKMLLIGLGLFVGMAGGLSLAFLFENLDSTLHTIDQIEQTTSLATIGKIPPLKRKQRKTFLNGNSPQGEAIRRLRTNIFYTMSAASLQTLLVTSAEPGEGKSTVVTNLAYMMAKSGRKIIVVDSDLRRPMLHKRFNLSNEVGLSNILCQTAALADALQATDIPGLQVLTSGPLPTDPAELLALPTMAHLLGQLSQQTDAVLIDAPAFLAVTDAAILATQVDGIALVVKRTQTRQEAVQTARRQLTDLDAKLVGVIVTQAELDPVNVYYR